MKFHLTSRRHVSAVSMYGVGFGTVSGSGFGHGSFSATYRGNGGAYGFTVGGDGEGFGVGHEDGSGDCGYATPYNARIHPRVSASDDVSEAIRTAALQPLLHIG